MSILNKIHIHETTYLFLLVSLFTGQFRLLMLLFVVILIHEFGHVIVALIYKYKIKKIIIYPYGGITRFDTLINTKIEKDLFIAISGVIVQSIYFYIIFFLYSKGIIREYIYNLFFIYHQSMLFFNLLPIIPLDGSKIVNLIFSKYLSLNLSNNLTVLVSFAALIVLLISNIYENNYSMVMVIFVLLQNIWDYYKKIEYIYNKFILERYLYNINYKSLKMINDKNKMYKNKIH